MQPDRLAPDILAGFPKPDLINPVMAVVAQNAHGTEQNKRLQQETAIPVQARIGS